GGAAQHLPNNGLVLLGVDARPLRTVALRALLDEEAFGLTTTADAQHLLQIDSTDDELLAGLDELAVLDEEAGALGDCVLDLVAADIGGDDDEAGLAAGVDRRPTGRLGDGGEALRITSYEEIDHAGQTLRHITRRRRGTTGLEGAHRQLRAGLTDRLGSDGTDRLTDVDELASGHGAAVVLSGDLRIGIGGE